MLQTNFNPTHTPKRRGCLIRLTLTVFGLLLLGLFLTGLGVVAYLASPPPSLNILIIGMDNGGSDQLIPQPDSILILGIDPTLLQVSIFSVPPDLLLDMPGEGNRPINTLGEDVSLLSAGLYQSLNIQINRYARMDFAGFANLIDAVGGVTIDVERVIVDDRYPTGDGDEVKRVRFESGVQHMDGERALTYVRVIGAYGEDDRVERQQQMLSALSLKLRKPANWPAALNVLNQYVETDLNPWDLLMLAPPMILNAGRYESPTPQ